MSQLNWTVQQNEINTPSKTGESINYTNIKTFEFPFGFLWAGMVVIVDANKQALSAPKFKVMFNQFVLAQDIATQEEAIQTAEEWFIPRAKSLIDLIAPESVEPVVEVVNV